jgi:hypothetical protein
MGAPSHGKSSKQGAQVDPSTQHQARQTGETWQPAGTTFTDWASI